MNSRFMRISLIVLLLLTGGLFLAISLEKFNNWRESELIKLAQESQKKQTGKEKLFLLEKLALLSPSEENFLKVGIEARENGYKNVGEQYLKRVKSPEGLFQLGSAYFESGEYALAEKTFKKALEKDSRDDFREALAKSYLFQGKFSQASASCADLDVNKTCQLVFVANSEWDKLTTLKPYGERLNLNIPNNEISRKVAAYSLLITHVNPQATKSYLEVNKNDLGKSRDGNFILGNHYFNIGDYQKSAEYLEKAKEFDPFYPQVYKHLSDAYLKLGQKEKAEAYSQKFSSLSF